MKTLKIISVLALVFFLACSEDSSTAPEKSVYIDEQTYRNEIIGIQLSAPENWTLAMNQEIAGKHALLVGSRTNYSGIPPSFNLITENAHEMKTAAELLSAGEEYISSAFMDVQFENVQLRMINEIECAQLVYKFTYDGVSLKQKQVLFLCHEKMSAALTFTTGNYVQTEVEAEFESIIKSIQLL